MRPDASAPPRSPSWFTARGAARWALLGAVALGAALITLGPDALGRGPGALRRRVSPAAAPGGAAAPSDTQAVYGPRRFDTPTGSSTYHVERFAVALGPGKRYTLQVDNGGVTGGSVILNGSTVLSSSDLGSGAARWTRVVQALAEDTIQVTVQGPAGAAVTVSLLAAPDPTFLVFGPERFSRSTSAPVTDTRHFSIAATAAAPYRMCLVNGNADGTQRIASATIVLNGVTVLSQGELSQQVGGLIKNVTLQRDNTVDITLTAKPSGFVTLCFRATDVTPPVITINQPPAGFITREPQVTVAGSVRDETATTVTVNTNPATVGSDGSFSATVALTTEGSTDIHVVATDAAQHSTDSTRTVIHDTQPPVLTLNAPADRLITKETSVTVSGTVTDLTPVMVNVNGIPLPVDAAGTFTGSVTLSEGANVLTVTATDAAGNATSAVRIVTRDTQPPVLTLTAPTDGATVTTETVDVHGTATDATTAVTVTVNGNPATVGSDGSFSATVALAVGPNTITAVATDAAGNNTTVTRSVTRTSSGLPPDPSTVATPIDVTVATTVGASTAFLYGGPKPVQTDVTPGAITPVRAAVLRGRVLTRDGRPLPGARITILGHPEYGQTLSRDDGMFDLAVNGGGVLTVTYGKSGFLSAQRPVDVPWQDYVAVDDAVLVAADAQATVIDFAQPAEIARGSVVSDQDGTRQATLIFPQGTQASLVLPDGSTQPIASLTVRATEYTVGPNGRKAMPAPLPPTSGYTYAVELSADEAVAADARTVLFTRPVAVYVDNFLWFPTGTHVPVGFYDRGRGTWVPSDDGRVVRILNTDGGIAALDVTGSGEAADAATLAALGITDEERQRVAQLYAPGQTLWRFATTHFSPADCNWPVLPPSDAQAPDQPPPQQGSGAPKPDDPCEKSGQSVIRCETQVLVEQLPLVGIPFDLVYASDRTAGRRDDYRITIPLTGDGVPQSLKLVELRVAIAGREFVDTFPAAPLQRSTFVWDGRDAYGRTVQGQAVATIRIAYVYPGSYGGAGARPRSFGSTAATPTVISVNRTRVEVTITQFQRVRLGSFRSPDALGGWSLPVHHAYGPITRTLYRGDGSKRTAEGIGAMIASAAGDGLGRFAGDGGPATASEVWGPPWVKVASDGSVYIADQNNNRIRRIAPDGIITTVAGDGQFCTPATDPCGDGGRATRAHLAFPTGVDLGPDGSIYIADQSDHRIRRVGLDGIITTVAGTGAERDHRFIFSGSGWQVINGPTGDGGPATEALLGFPLSVAVAPDGSVYFTDDGLVRKVGADGIVTTVAGNDSVSCQLTTGTTGPCGDGSLAIHVPLSGLFGLAIGSDGSIYASEFRVGFRLRRVTPDGILHTAAGTGAGCNTSTDPFCGDGGPATRAPVDPWGMSLGPDGSLYIAELSRGVIRRVGSDGIITTVAGRGGRCFPPTARCGEDGPALAALLGDPSGVAVAPDGSLYVAELDNNRIHRVASPLPHFSAGDLAVASEDGAAVYQFDANGRHLRTGDALTGSVVYNFAYDGAARLTAVTNADGNVTSIDRAADGTATAIRSPYDQRTALAMRADGLLGGGTNPAGEATTLDYDAATGLLVTRVDGRGNSSTFTYDALGLLTRDQDPAGGFTTLLNRSDATGLEVVRTTALGQVTRNRVETRVGGGTRRSAVDARGLTTTTIFDGAGVTTLTQTEGTVKTLQPAPDPRFGMQAALAGRRSVSTPGGLVSSTVVSRHVTLADPNNPLSVTGALDTIAINGRPYTTRFDRAHLLTTHNYTAGRMTIESWDAVGRVVRREVAGLVPTLYSYDERGRERDIVAGGRAFHFEYDAMGLLGGITDPAGRTRRMFHDPAGRLTRVELEDGRAVQYTYDANGNVTSVTPPGRPAYHFGYSPVDLMTEYDRPPLGSDVGATRFQHNANRQLVEVDRPDGTVVGFDYDPAGRLSTVRVPTGTIGYTYAQATGNLTDLTAPDGGRVSYGYDGDLPTRIAWTGTVSGSIEVSYGSDFQVASQTVNGAMPIAFQYDWDGLLTAAGWLTISRLTQNRLISGSALGNVVATQAYNAHGEIVDLDAQVSGTSRFHMAYERDSLGRALSVRQTVDGLQTRYDYAYDLAGRLTQVNRDGAPFQTFQYDDNGNRVSLVTPSGSVTGAYDVRDQVTQYGDAQFTYTPNGEVATRLVGGETTRYAYDGLGNLARVTLPSGTTIDYVLDGRNRRIGKRIDGQLVEGFLYSDQLRIAAALDGTGQVVSRFAYGTRPNVPDYLIKGGRTYRILADQVGSVRLVVDVGTGDVVQRIDYDAFGEVTLNTNPDFQPFGFAGGLYDAETGLTHFGAREYDAHLGRWTSSDPALFTGGSGNLYGYVLADPVNLVDVNGLGFQIGFHLEVGLGLDFKFEFQIGTEGVGIGAGVGLGVKADIGFDPPWHFKNGNVEGGVDASLKGEFGAKHTRSPTGEESSCSVDFEANLGPLKATLGHDFECGDFGSIEATTDIGLGASETVGCKSFTHW